MADAFSWVGFVLVNLGFITLISWGASSYWVLGFVLTALYTVLLVVAARYCERQTAGTHREDNDSSNETQTSRNLDSRANLLYALAVLSLGVTGFFLPVNLFSDDCYVERYDNDQGYWKTDVDSLPSGVRGWARGRSSATPFASYMYLESYGVTLFGGVTGDAEMVLIRVQDGGKPQQYNQYTYPREFVLVEDKSCFVAKQRSLLCTDGVNFDAITTPFDAISSRLVYEGLYWFQAYPDKGSGNPIFSLDPVQMNLTSYSTLETDDPPSECPSWKARAWLALVVSALPILVASIALWKRGVPSMSMLVYVGLTLVYLSLYSALDPQSYDHSWNWWCSLSGLAWMVFLCYRRLVHDESHIWGIVPAGMAFAYGMTVLLLDKGDTFLMWLALNLLCFAPLLGMGAAVNSAFLLTLGTLGLLMDAGRFAGFVGVKAPDSLYVPIVSMVFALAGMAIGILGIQFRKIQPRIHERVQGWVQRLRRETVVVGQDEGAGTVEAALLSQEEDVETTPLA